MTRLTLSGLLLLAAGAAIPDPLRAEGVESWMTIRNDDHAILWWKSVPGGIYHIERSGDFATPGGLVNWEYDRFSFPPTGAVGTLSSIDLGLKTALTPRFYRLQAYEPPAGCLFYESFEGGGIGWAPFALQGSRWDVGLWDPNCPVEAGPPAPHTGLFAAGSDVFSTYVDGTASRYDSPIIDLTNEISASLTFWHWYEIEDGDVGTVSVVNSAGQTILSNIYSVTGTSTGWQEQTVNLPANAMGQVIKLRFNFFSDLGQVSELAGWYIDDLCVMPGP